jgi:haloalkane dehalogenase
MTGGGPAADESWRKLYPFRSQYFDQAGQRMHYLDEGQGEVLLLVHGNPTWSFLWRRLILELRDRYRLIAPDHIGCGLSEKPQQYPYTLAQHVTNLRRLVEHLDLKQITLVGHDWGGAIGMGAAVADPDRYARLVLMNTAAFRSPHMPWRIRVCRTPILGRLAVQGLSAFSQAALWMATSRPMRLSSDVRAGLLAPYDNWQHRRAIYEFVSDIPLSPRHPSFDTLLSIERQLPQLRELPTCLIWGMQDWCFTPHFLQRFQELFPGATTHPIHAAGHWVMEDAPDEVIGRVERFLQANPLPTIAAHSVSTPETTP